MISKFLLLHFCEVLSRGVETLTTVETEELLSLRFVTIISGVVLLPVKKKSVKYRFANIQVRPGNLLGIRMICRLQR